jgi:uncharacterized protein (TIGR02145 family)
VYQWQSSTNGTSGWTDVPASTSGTNNTYVVSNNPTNVTSPPVAQYYRCKISNSYDTTDANSVFSNVYAITFVATCGAYTVTSDTDPTVIWRDFLCHNLGAETSLDPFTPAPGLNGNYYQWNTKNTVATVNDVISSTWNTNISTTWDAANDPCPEGYRTPTQSEWVGIAVAANNPQIMPKNVSWTNSANNFSSGYMVGPALYLPAAGERNRDNGSLVTRGNVGSYWSTTYSGGSNASYLHFDSGIIRPSFVYSLSAGFSIRCIEGN